MVKPSRTNNNCFPEVRRPASRELVFKNGWYVLRSRGAVVTSELVEKIQEELDREDALCAACLQDGEG